MGRTVTKADVPAGWDVASHHRLDRSGVSMAGFGVPGTLADGLRLVPHPAVMVAVDFGPNRSLVMGNSGTRQRGSVATGPGFGYGGTVRASGTDVACVQVRLSPVIAGAVLGVRPSELDGCLVTLDDLLGSRASRLAERLSEADTWRRRFAVTEAALLRPRATRPLVDRQVAWAWHRIVATRGRVTVAGLAVALGWSRKRLWSRFTAQIGLTPKRAARLVRFDHAVHRLVAGEGAARVAAVGGFTDQSHLHRDVVAFTGVTPTAVTGEPFLAVDDVAWPGLVRPGLARSGAARSGAPVSSV